MQQTERALKDIVIAIGIAPETDGQTLEPPIVILDLPDYDSLPGNQRRTYDEIYEFIDTGYGMDGCHCITDIPGVYVADYIDCSFFNVRIIKRRNYNAISDY